METWIDRNIGYLNKVDARGLNHLADDLLQVDCPYSSIMAGRIEREKQESSSKEKFMWSHRSVWALPLLLQLCYSAVQ